MQDNLSDNVVKGKKIRIDSMERKVEVINS